MLAGNSSLSMLIFGASLMNQSRTVTIFLGTRNDTIVLFLKIGIKLETVKLVNISSSGNALIS